MTRWIEIVPRDEADRSKAETAERLLNHHLDREYKRYLLYGTGFFARLSVVRWDLTGIPLVW